MPDFGTNVFVSYSRSDASLIAPIVKLLRTNRSLVFQDIDDIRPGKKWRDEIDRGLAASQLVVVFWCDHASESEEVSSEWRAALDQEKDLLPLLLDATPLPPELSEYQWIDFRETVGPNHGSSIAPEPRIAETAPRRSQGWMLSRGVPYAAAAALLVTVVAGAMFMFGEPAVPVATSVPAPSAGPAPGHPASPEPGPPDAFWGTGLVSWLAVMLAIVVGLVWLRKRAGGQSAPVDDHRPAGEYQQQIASQIEAEIVRRTKGAPGRSLAIRSPGREPE